MTTQPGTGVPTGGETDGTDEIADLFRALGRQIRVAREQILLRWAPGETGAASRTPAKP